MTGELPPRVQRLADYLGEADAIAVVRAYGGRPLYVPLKSTGAMEDALGPEIAARLVEVFGGENLGILPSCHAAMLERRNARWLDEHGQGKTITQLAAEEKLNWRTVHNAIQSARQARPPPATNRQMRMFD